MRLRALLAITLALCAPWSFAQQKETTNVIPELDQLLQSREAGLVTDWNLLGRYGKHEQTDFSRAWAPERRKKQKVGSRHERKTLSFPNGQFVLPANASNGVYYASARVYLFSDGDWNVWAESANAMQIFVDGAPVLLRPGSEQDAMRAVHESVHLSRGPHSILAKFVREASPFRVAVMPPSGGLRHKRNIPLHELAPESLVLSASLR
ncbi:MAG TPA: hypothetical protein VMU24_10675 [Candidatus Acidoferrales bacterium]|jgi:hypothetical protein|nr:hypothetical protein [Candidatus Acidoferrales bacterium]